MHSNYYVQYLHCRNKQADRCVPTCETVQKIVYTIWGFLIDFHGASFVIIQVKCFKPELYLFFVTNSDNPCVAVGFVSESKTFTIN